MLTWDQMVKEFKIVKKDYEIEITEPIIKRFLENKNNIGRGRKILTDSIPQVLEYYERGLRRRGIN